AGPRRRDRRHAAGAVDRPPGCAREVPVLVARAGHRQESRIPDEYEARGTRRTAARIAITETDAIMFISKKAIPRRTVLKGAGAALALPFLEAMVPARTTLAQSKAAAPPRFVGLFVPHGGAPGYWIPEKVGPLAEQLPFIYKPLE